MDPQVMIGLDDVIVLGSTDFQGIKKHLKTSKAFVHCKYLA